MRARRGNLRSAAAWVMDRTLASRRPATGYLSRAQRDLDPRDRALLWELSLGGLRWLRRLDDVIELASSRPMRAIDSALRSPLRLGVYQILFLDRVPAHAAVHEAVEEARRRTGGRGAGFVNAVLRQVARQPSLGSWSVREPDPVRRLAIETSHPDLLVRRWWSWFGEARTRRLLEANNRAKPAHLLTFQRRGGRQAVATRLTAEGILTRPSTLAPQGLVVRSGDALASQCFRDGEIYVQDEASQAAAVVPPPRGEERVLDLAAAPGGKAFSLLAVQPTLRLVAADLSPLRLEMMSRNATRLQLSFPMLVMDGREPAVRCTFERVVVDLPCTGSGTLRKHPELKWRITPAEIRRLAAEGLGIVRAAARLVGNGGLLSIITCSLEEEETSGLAAALLARTDEFEPLPLTQYLAPPLLQHVIGPGSWQLLPADDHDGFSVQVLRRRWRGSR